MLCIYCQGETQVINSRHQRRTNQVWRRRKCLACKSVFTSTEAADLSLSLSFRTSQNTLQPFSRDILFISLYDSLRHRKSATSDASALNQTILSKLLPKAKGAVINREAVVQLTHDVLKHFDKAAAVHYRAFHPL